MAFGGKNQAMAGLWVAWFFQGWFPIALWTRLILDGYQWDYLRSPAQNLSFFAGYWHGLAMVDGIVLPRFSMIFHDFPHVFPMISQDARTLPGWWFGTFLWLSIQLGMSSSQLTFSPSFFREVGIPTTNQLWLNIFIWPRPGNSEAPGYKDDVHLLRQICLRYWNKPWGHLEVSIVMGVPQ